MNKTLFSEDFLNSFPLIPWLLALTIYVVLVSVGYFFVRYRSFIEKNWEQTGYYAFTIVPTFYWLMLSLPERVYDAWFLDEKTSWWLAFIYIILFGIDRIICLFLFYFVEKRSVMHIIIKIYWWISFVTSLLIFGIFTRD